MSRPRPIRPARPARRAVTGRERACRRCGCTNRFACPGGCAWVAASVDLCTSCLRSHERPLAEALHQMETALSAIRQPRVNWPGRGLTETYLIEGCRELAKLLLPAIREAAGKRSTTDAHR